MTAATQTPRTGAPIPIWQAGIAARLFTRPCGNWRIPHALGVPGDIAFVPYRVLGRVSVAGGYSADPTGSAS